MSAPLARPLRLPCGAVLPNRLAKAAMTEGLADRALRATSRHEVLYRTWSEGGAGLLLTGNVQIDRYDLERPGNVAIDITDAGTVGPDARERLARWARAGTLGGNHLWMQISHAGRQSPWYVTRRPKAPSPVRLRLLGNYCTPEALTEPEILDLVRRFAAAAAIARETGFTGVQVHGAHGYLISSFLSPVTNLRTDAWGGSLANRARFLIETLRAVRRSVGNDFPVAVKLNSDDFRKGGFSHDECLQVVRWLNEESIDLLEVSGGTYEQPRLIGAEGRADEAIAVRASTRAREAYFLDYAEAIRRVARMPLMVTGGFRTRATMEAAITASAPVSGTPPAAGAEASPGTGACDVIGLGRPLCWQPDFPRQLLDGTVEAVEPIEQRLCFATRGWRSPTSRLTAMRVLNAFAAMSWFYCQLFRMGDGLPPDPRRGMLSALSEYLRDELSRGLALRPRAPG